MEHGAYIEKEEKNNNIQKKYKDFGAVVFKTEKNTTGDRIFTSIISTADIDRDGEVVIPMGMISKDFEKNPIVVWNHDYNQPPIGKCLELKRENGKLIAISQLANDVPMADILWKLMEQDCLHGVSIGFMPTQDGQREPTKKDKEDFGEEVKRVYNKWQLLEYSLVTLPANQNAVITSVGKALKKGIVTTEEIKSVFGEIKIPVIEEEIIEELKEIKEEINNMKIEEPKNKNKTILIYRKKPKSNIDYVKLIREELAKQQGKFFLDD